MYKFSTKLQIRFNDIDIAGHVNNAVYLYYYDYGRMKYFDTVFKNIINWREQGLVIVNICIDYLEPIYLNNKICVDTKIVETGKKSLTMTQQVRDVNNNKIFSNNKTILVAYNYLKNYSFEIPEEWKMHINNFEKLTK